MDRALPTNLIDLGRHLGKHPVELLVPVSVRQLHEWQKKETSPDDSIPLSLAQILITPAMRYMKPNQHMEHFGPHHMFQDGGRWRKEGRPLFRRRAHKRNGVDGGET